MWVRVVCEMRGESGKGMLVGWMSERCQGGWLGSTVYRQGQGEGAGAGGGVEGDAAGDIAGDFIARVEQVRQRSSEAMAERIRKLRVE